MLLIIGTSFPAYAAEAPMNAIPAGPEWAGVLWGGFYIYGKLGWWLRRMEDLHIFASILPFGKAFDVFRSGRSICETCSICSVETIHSHA
jgi:hypothetical protein